MNVTKKTCHQCGTGFELFPKDQTFYQEMGVPEPKLCITCRRQHLLAWRNQRVLYNNTCSFTGKPVISLFAPGSQYRIADRDYWWSDVWDAHEYGTDFDFSKTFAEQFDALLHRVPMACIFNGKSTNSGYCNHAGQMKNCYLVHASWTVEDSLYGEMVMDSRDCVDNLQLQACERCYESVGCSRCSNVKYCLYSERCVDSAFLFDCRDCLNCVGCVNLRNKQYHILNKAYSKEEYEKRLAELKLDTREGIQAFQNQFFEFKKGLPHVFAHLMKCEDVTGDQVIDTKRSTFCFNVITAQDCAYVMNTAGILRDTYDGYGVGAGLERGYYLFDSGAQGMRQLFCGIVWGCSYAYYSYNCHSSFEIFGCSGIRGGKYCILNKQYTQAEYEELKPKIIAHMKETGEWGEFFPSSISPFGYNETLASDYVPLSKEEARKLNFKWQDHLPGTYKKETVGLDIIGSRAADAEEEILKEVFACETCGKNFKFIKQELEFHQKINQPLSRKCPSCRHNDRAALRNPHWLWHRQCTCELPNHQWHPQGRCPHEFETVYAPERPEKVFCQECYQTEVV